MNIFYLSEDPFEAAAHMCDKHIVKMVLESAQMLSTAHRVLDEGVGLADGWDSVLYKIAHRNHPCTKWVMESRKHYDWLYNHYVALGAEYTLRYGKIHKSAATPLSTFLRHHPHTIENKPWRNPPTAMKNFPECIVEGDVVASYRNYYIVVKRKFATWKNVPEPFWWPKE